MDKDKQHNLTAFELICKVMWAMVWLALTKEIFREIQALSADDRAMILGVISSKGRINDG